MADSLDQVLGMLRADPRSVVVLGDDRGQTAGFVVSPPLWAAIERGIPSARSAPSRPQRIKRPLSKRQRDAAKWERLHGEKAARGD